MKCARRALHAAVRPLSLAHLRHAPRALPDPPDWWRASTSAPAPLPGPPSCGTAPPPGILVFQRRFQVARRRRGSETAPRPSKGEGALCLHASALALAPGLTVAACSSEVQSLLSSAATGPFLSSALHSLLGLGPLLHSTRKCPLPRSRLTPTLPTPAACQEVGPRRPRAEHAGPRGRC